MSHLTARGGYEIELEGDILQLESKLKDIPGINQWEIISNSDTKRHFLSLTTDSDYEIGKDIAALIIREGLDLYEMKRTRATLEDVFLDLVTEESSPDNQDLPL